MNIKSYRWILVISALMSVFLMGGCDIRRNDKKTDDAGEQAAVDSSEIIRSRAVLRSRTLGLAYLEENKLEEAEAEFKKLIELAPAEALGYANLGIVYMRMGKYKEAEEQLKIAIEINPDDPDIRFNLAKVYDLSDQEDASRKELEKSMEIAPDHVQTLYGLAESYQNQSDTYSISQWEKYLRKIVETTPTNLVARLYLIEVLIRNGDADQALKNLEEIQRISPAFPDEAEDYYRTAVDNLHSGRLTEALTSVRIFHNLLKLTNSYQTDIQQLKGTSASRVGTPVISFSESKPAFLMEGESLLDAMRFTDVTASAGLNILAALKAYKDGNNYQTIHLAAGDMDRDGDVDIYASGYNSIEKKYSHHLLRNSMGRFQDISASAGIQHQGVEYEAIFADYDNDGFLDIYITMEGANLLYANINEGLFREVAVKTGVDDKDAGNRILFFDIDQEGDLDLILGNQHSTKVYRNNGDKTFSDVTRSVAFGDDRIGCRDINFGDFDDDGDVDLLIVRENGVSQLYINLRDGNFMDMTEKSGISDPGVSYKAESGDYNNDGFLDFFILMENKTCQLYRNNGAGSFSVDPESEKLITGLGGMYARDALFFDFDNDGFLDLVVVGEPQTEEGKGIVLFHNKGNGTYEDVSSLLPDGIFAGSQVEVLDYNEDGDMDILISGTDGGIYLFRNDGGNANHHLKIQLVGIRTGSGKNNYFGIGAKVELRAGELYQMKTVTQPNVHFGLGSQDKVDVVRILWTNGVPQNIFSPGSDQDLIEEQELKGSCPFLYTWNGKKYEFQKDMMWRSALGMPLGIMGGDNLYASASASIEYLKIPSESLKVHDGKYSLQITSELWETIYFDKLRLIAIDHPDSMDIYVDESLRNPSLPEETLYYVYNKKNPFLVSDGSGADLRSLVSQKDNRYISNLKSEKYQGITEMHELIIEFGGIEETENLFLFLNGWIFPTDASINVAISQSGKWNAVPPYLQVVNEKGNWETVVENIGFPTGKDKTVIVNLTGKVRMDDPRVRICTNMEIYWDYIFYSAVQENGSGDFPTLSPCSADLHFRGFSAKYRKGGRYGPHWFEYEEVSRGPRWRDLSGYYTRYGEVLTLLEEADNMYVIMNAGDEITIEFDAGKLPELPQRWVRDFLVCSVGWVKDGDMNTAHGNTVEPLPYHGMCSYPYSNKDRYPETGELRSYFKKYNTRKVTNEEFRTDIRKEKE